jgi:signal transduction histidine kinase
MRPGLPRSLAGRLMLLLGLALFVAQLANFALILNERQKLSLVQNVGPAVTRFASAAADIGEAAPEFRAALLSDLSHRGARYRLADAPAIPPDQRASDIEARLTDALGAAGVRHGPVRASDQTSAADGRGRVRRTLKLETRLESAGWLSASLPAPARDPWLNARLAAATALLYLIVLGATLFAARQVTGPMRALTRAAERFRGKAAPEPVPPSGPADVRAAIQAFNDMNARLVKLIDEKDRMLGAIGHDLRTPLASLRIRLEGMEPEDERAASIRKVGEMEGILQDILVLAQSGRDRADMRRADVSSIVEAAVEEFRDLGHEVAFVPAGPHVLEVSPNLLRRAVSNLIENALKYGGECSVRVQPDGGQLRISVHDEGPGIDPGLLPRVEEPFFRAEESRNRATGGTGLGLAIVRSVVDLHNGSLTLENEAGGGFTATIGLNASA